MTAKRPTVLTLLSHPLTMALVGWAAFAAFAADETHHGQLWLCNEPLEKFLHLHTQPQLVLLLSLVSGLGNLIVVLGIAAAVGGLLGLRRRWHDLAVWITALVGCGILNHLLKEFFQIPRPSRWTLYTFEPYEGFSFPSGHTMAATVTLGMIVVLLWPFIASPRRRAALLLAATALSFTVAFGLLYIGVHTLTEVLAALAASAGWIGILRLIPRNDAISDRAD